MHFKDKGGSSTQHAIGQSKSNSVIPSDMQSRISFKAMSAIPLGSLVTNRSNPVSTICDVATIAPSEILPPVVYDNISEYYAVTDEKHLGIQLHRIFDVTSKQADCTVLHLEAGRER